MVQSVKSMLDVPGLYTSTHSPPGQVASSALGQGFGITSVMWKGPGTISSVGVWLLAWPGVGALVAT